MTSFPPLVVRREAVERLLAFVVVLFLRVVPAELAFFVVVFVPVAALVVLFGFSAVMIP
jgi:hypothetical protein